MILEMDNAYRYRAQDLLPELDKEALRKNASKELLRLLDVMTRREKQQTIKDTWVLARYAIRFYLMFDKEMKNIVVSVLLNLNMEKVELTKEDKQFCIPRKDYVCGFITNPSESDKVLIQSADVVRAWRENRRRVQDESTKAHQGVTNLMEIKRLDKKYTKMLDAVDANYQVERKRLYELFLTYERI